MVQLVKVEDRLCVANMVAQHGYVNPANPVAIRYDALARCLSGLAGRIGEGTIIHMPRIGCGLAGGDWSHVEPLIEEHLCGQELSVTVYDFE